MDTITLIALIVFVGAIPFAIAASVLVRHLARRKGRIVIDMPTRNYRYGDTVQGSIVITANKTLRAREISVALVAIKRTRSREGTHVRRIHYIPQFLAENVTLAPASPRNFAFALELPEGNDQADQSVALAYKDLPMGDMFANTLKTLPTQLQWTLAAEVACDGLDLSEQKEISVLA